MNDAGDIVERLLRDLDSEELEPSVIDVGQAIVTGRRRVRRRRLATVGALGAAVLAAAGVIAVIGIPAAAVREPAAGPSTASVVPPSAARSAQPPPTRPAAPVPAINCVAHRLTLPAGATSGVVTGADPTGRYLVGYVFGHGLAYGTVLWTDGSPKLIDAPAEDESISVNSSGEVAGSGLDVHGDVSEQIGWTYRAGKVTRLGDANHSYRVYAVNEHGDLLVQQTSRYQDPTTAASTTPLVLGVLGQDGSLRRLTGPGSDSVRFSGDLDDDGTVVGGDLDGGVATVWHLDGTSETLHGGATSTVATDIRDGWVLGGSGDSSLPGLFPVVRWDLRAATPAPTPYPKLQLGGTWGINRYGWIAGSTADLRPVVAAGDTTIRLPLPTGAKSGAGTNATTISDDGRTIGGQANLLNEDVVPVRWLCH